MNYDIYVIGSGGTGTYFLKEISGYLAAGNFKERISISSLHIFDGDIVESKNLIRQKMYLPEDVGRNKADVMAEILNSAHFNNKKDLYWQPHSDYVVPDSDFEKIVANGIGIPIIVGCVDNHACRLYLESLCETLTDVMYIDTANSSTIWGEVVCMEKHKSVRLGRYRSESFPSVKKGDLRHVTEMSCEELNTVEPQHPFTNMESGQIAAQILKNLLEYGDFNNCIVSFNVRSLERQIIDTSIKENISKAVDNYISAEEGAALLAEALEELPDKDEQLDEEEAVV